MGLFGRAKREPVNYDDPLLDDQAWLSAGAARYDRLIVSHYGSPDTIAAGGDERTEQSDCGAALFFYQKAIDTLHSIYVCGFNDSGPASWSRQPSSRDHMILDRYLGALRSVRSVRPSAPVDASVREVTHRMRAISTQFQKYRLDHSPYANRLALLAQSAQDVDVSDIFWT